MLILLASNDIAFLHQYQKVSTFETDRISWTPFLHTSSLAEYFRERCSLYQVFLFAWPINTTLTPTLHYDMRERKVQRQVCALKRQSITCIIVNLLHISKCWELFLQRCATSRSTHGRLMNKHWNAHRWSKVMPVYFLQNATFIRQASLFFKTVMLLGRPLEHWMRPAQ
jgi:hypothetical protein